MSIDNSTVKKIAKLSKLKVDNISENIMRDELNNILDWVNNESMPMRDDEVKIYNDQNDILKNAPEKNTGFFVVPKVVE